MPTSTIEQEKSARQQEYFTCLAALGDIKQALPGGITLYKHQQEALRVALFKPRFIIGDAVGLGKTFVALYAALAKQQVYDYDVYVIATKSAISDWEREAVHIGVRVRMVQSWGKVASWGVGNPKRPFILIVDEAHRMANEKAQRTKAVNRITDSDLCKGVYYLTATPYTNGEPLNAYSLLLSCKHPLVWDADPKERTKKKYIFINKFYERERVKIGFDRAKQEPIFAWKNTKKKNLDVFFKAVKYTPGAKDNSHHACIISRRKKDCIDLPPEEHIKIQAELSEEAAHSLQQEYMRMWDEYETRLQEKRIVHRKEQEAKGLTGSALAKHMWEYDRFVRRAETMVEYNFAQHAGAFAKGETVLALVEEILGSGEKVVLYTTFVDVAYVIGALIEKQCKKRVGYITGEQSRAERDALMADFQSDTGKTQAVFITAAGSESITLTAASYTILIDRPWSPVKLIQVTGRTHRVDKKTLAKKSVAYYWVQIPDETLAIDSKVDTTLQQKMGDVDEMQFGEKTEGVDFVEEIDGILRAAYDKLKNK